MHGGGMITKMAQDWFSISTLLNYLKSESIYLDDLDFDKFGFSYNNSHIDVYDGMINKNGDWVIDWENAPECKTEDIKDFFTYSSDGWEIEFNKFMEWVDNN